MTEQSTGSESRSHSGSRQLEEIPTLKPQVKLAVEQLPGYGAAFSALALTPGAIGQFGARLAQSSAQASAKSAGTESGRDPHGDILPPMTDVDKVYGEAYSAQSQATLGLQAQSMMNKGQEELDKAYKLSPGMISTFNANMSEGMKEILDLAPSSIKANLQNQFKNHLLSTAHNYNEKLISQNKEQTKATAASYGATQAKTIFDSQFTDNPESGEQIYQDMKSVNAANRAVGMMSPAQEAADNKKNELLLLSGRYGAAAQTALKQGKLPEFLHDFIQNKIPSPNKGEGSLGESDKEALGKQILSFVSQQEAFESRDQQLLQAQAKLDVAQGSLSDTRLLEYKEQMTPTNFANFYSSLLIANNKSTSAKKTSEALDHSWSNIEDWERFSSSAKDKKYFELQDLAIAKNPDITPMQAKLGTAIAAAGSIAAFNKELDNGMSSGDAQQMLEYGNAYRAMHNIDATKVSGVSSEALAINHTFHNMLDRKVPADIAAQQSREVITQRTPEQRKNIDENWKDFHSKQLSTSSQRQDYANSLMDGSTSYGFDKNIPMKDAVSTQLLQAFEENFRLTGNADVAKEMTKTQVKGSYGDTEINGIKEWVYMPPEKVVELDSKAVPLMHDEMKEQLAAQFAYGKDAFDKGFVSTYYELGENEPGKPPVVYEVHADGQKSKFTVNIVTAPGQSLFSDPANPSLSAYDITLKNDKGVMQAFFNTAFANGVPPYYRPNINALKKRYEETQNLNGNPISFHDAAQKVMTQHKEDGDNTLEDRLARMKAELQEIDNGSVTQHKENIDNALEDRLARMKAELQEIDNGSVTQESSIPSVDMSKSEQTGSQIPSVDMSKSEKTDFDRTIKDAYTAIKKVDVSNATKDIKAKLLSAIEEFTSSFDKPNPENKSSIPSVDMSKPIKTIQEAMTILFPNLSKIDANKTIKSATHTIMQLVESFQEARAKEISQNNKNLSEDEIAEITKTAHSPEKARLLKQTMSDIKYMKGDADYKGNLYLTDKLIQLYPSINKQQAIQIITELNKILNKGKPIGG